LKKLLISIFAIAIAIGLKGLRHVDFGGEQGYSKECFTEIMQAKRLGRPKPNCN
tara:strand:+ start:224 stop:385 length:162 start_codon:yes stop_codon:yes gene_type:complete